MLRDIDLRIEPRMRLGIVGPSGDGKSTLPALLPRLYDIPEDLDPDGRPRGTVRFDGRDVRDLRLADLRRSAALVPQQALLFEGSIRTNPLYADPEAAEDRIREALRIADLADTVDSFPDGLDTPVGERGSSLSRGQRQRLALARAIVSEPAVLHLDHCTSTLDSATESRFQQALARNPPGRTFVIVSHKIASVRRADRIVVLESGTSAEQGTHAELLARAGHYAETHRHQTSALIAAG